MSVEITTRKMVETGTNGLLVTLEERGTVKMEIVGTATMPDDIPRLWSVMAF